MKKITLYAIFSLAALTLILVMAVYGLAYQQNSRSQGKTEMVEIAVSDQAGFEAAMIEPAAGDPAQPALDNDAQTPSTTSLEASNGDIVPVQKSEAEAIDPTHPMIRLTPDKTEMVRLTRDAKSIVVGNPAHASVLMDNPRLLLVVPRAPGATYFSVLDKDGTVIMQRHIIVASPKDQYVRIRRSCAGQENCESTSVYYCPDMCHKVQINPQGQ